MMMLQDFIQHWYKGFVVAAWKTLCASVQGGRDGQMAFTSALFQTLSSPDVNCLPNDLTAPLDGQKMLQVWQNIADNIDVLYQDSEGKAKNTSGAYYQSSGTGNWGGSKKRKAPAAKWKAPEPMKLMTSGEPMMLTMNTMPALSDQMPTMPEQSLGPLY